MVTVAAAPASSGTSEDSVSAGPSRSAPGEVADAHEDERRHAQRLQQRDVEEQPEAEAEGRADEPAAEQADAHDRQRREVGGAARDGELGDERDLDDADHDAERDDPCDEAPSRLRPRDLREDLDVRRGGAGRRTAAACTSCVSDPGSSTVVTLPIGRPSGNSDGYLLSIVPRVTTRSPTAIRPPPVRLNVQRARVAGARGQHDAGHAPGGRPRRDARRVVGDERHHGGGARRLRHRADEAVLVEDGHAVAQAVGRALVDLHRRVPDGRGLCEDARADRAVRADAEALIEVQLAAEQLVLALRVLVLQDLLAELVALGGDVGELALRAEACRRTSRTGRAPASGRGSRPPGPD